MVRIFCRTTNQPRRTRRARSRRNRRARARPRPAAPPRAATRPAGDRSRRLVALWYSRYRRAVDIIAVRGAAQSAPDNGRRVSRPPPGKTRDGVEQLSPGAVFARPAAGGRFPGHLARRPSPQSCCPRYHEQLRRRQRVARSSEDAEARAFPAVASAAHALRRSRLRPSAAERFARGSLVLDSSVFLRSRGRRSRRCGKRSATQHAPAAALRAPAALAPSRRAVLRMHR